ncbi:hypothetical protein BKA56DRAFT_627959 [Ilyonectria sp. MPI-CAGE-AT-0026]|nr:hypothetical protein BKA56DRAFT_627959 [Ilyonectria sp. MPI-CAGE-AT-0026]
MENNNGLNKLLPKSISSKRLRKKQERDAEAPGQDDDVRGRAKESRETLASTLSTNLADDEESRSYGSYESDPEPSLPRATTLSTHPSQIGYLTTSSPIIQAGHFVEVTSPATDVDSNSSASKSSTFPSKRSVSIESKEPKELRVRRSKTSLLPPHNPKRRSPSPGGKFKGIFKGKKSTNSSPERQVPDDSHPPPKPGKQQATPSADPNHPKVPPIIEPPAPAKVAPSDKRSRVQPKVDTSLPPRTPPTGDKPAPVIVNTPPTPTEFAHSSAQSSPDRKSFWNAPGPSSSTNGTSPSRNMNAHRRSRSGSVNIGPSKLSNIVSAPLSPTPETGETTASATPTTGFFSSMISVAQNAASTFSNIQNTGIGLGANKGKTATPKTQDLSEPSEAEGQAESTPVPTITRAHTSMEAPKDHRQSAVQTLGAGELSLSQLGLGEPPSSVGTPMSNRFPDMVDTRARSESAPVDSPVTPVELVPDDMFSRPRSLYEASGERTPPPPDFVDKTNGVQRTSSLRSALKQPHRKRGSSVTTGNTIGAAIVAANSSLAHPNISVPKLTGFAIASKKRNRDFHDLFKSVPDDDYLIEDYSCALQREILAHGRLYVSEGHLCFSSNIFGWTTTLVMSFDEIVSVEKRSTALVFKNGLMVTTLHAKHIFASFTSRDATYDLIVNIWKLGHPTLKSTLNGVRLEGTGGDKTEKIDAEPPGVEEDHAGSESDDESDGDDDEEEYYDEDIHEEMHNASLNEGNGGEGDVEKSASRKASGVAPTNGGSSDDAPATSGTSADFPGPAAHAPTDCGDSATHYDRVVGDDVIPAPIGKVYNLVFGQASVNWMIQWLTGEQKCFDLQMDEKKGLSLEDRSRNYSYIKPLNGAIGPKQTKCIVTETLDNLDYEKAISLTVSTQTPDVPSGNVFSVKTKYCFSWAENNATRLQVNCTIEWTGKSWLKGPIEKGANDGQVQFCKDLFAALKSAVSTRPAAPAPLPSAMKGRKKGKKARTAHVPTGIVENHAPKRPDKKSWGALEPVRGLLEPIADIIQPLLTGNVMYGLLVGLLVATWFGFGFTPSSSPQDIGMYRPERLAAYDEIWRREDSELWEWLEERVGMDRLNADRVTVRKRAVEPRTVEESLREARMDEREVEEAIRVTEEKLRVLKEVMGKKAKAKEANNKIPE